MKLNFLLLVCILVSWAATVASSATQRHRQAAAAPSPMTDCSTLVMDNMISCMQYLSKTGTETKPDDSCCSGLKTVMKTDPNCLCYAIKSASSFGLDLNMTRAAELPSDCGIGNAPSISNCTATPTPGVSPANPPNLPPTAQPPAEVPSAGPGPTPSPSKPNSGAYSISATFSVIFTQLIYFSIFFALA